MKEEFGIGNRIKKEEVSFNRHYSLIIDNLDKLSSGGGTYTLARLLIRQFHINNLLDILDEITQKKYISITHIVQEKLNQIKDKMGEKEYYTQIYLELREDSQVYFNWIDKCLLTEIFYEYINDLNYRDSVYVLQINLENKIDISEIKNKVAEKDDILKKNAKKLIEDEEFPTIEYRQKIRQFLPDDFWWWRLEDFVEEEG